MIIVLSVASGDVEISELPVHVQQPQDGHDTVVKVSTSTAKKSSESSTDEVATPNSSSSLTTTSQTETSSPDALQAPVSVKKSKRTKASHPEKSSSQLESTAGSGAVSTKNLDGLNASLKSTNLVSLSSTSS